MSDIDLERRARDRFDALADLEPTLLNSELDNLERAEPTLAARVAELLAADREAGTSTGRLVGQIFGSLERATFESLLGLELGPYRLESFLGAGGMGAVYAARRFQGFVQEVAIKLLRPGSSGVGSRVRFERERQLLASLDHPNIARLIGGGLTLEGQPYLVMELVRGEAITTYADQRRLGVTARLQLLIEVAAAVGHAHRRLVVHRDIKPGNVLVDSDGRPRLLDFGIATVLEGSSIESGSFSTGVLTAEGGRPLTPGYASPEQVEGGELGTGSDQYSLAALTCELLVGEGPLRFESAAWIEIRKGYQQKRARTLDEIWAALPADEAASRAERRGTDSRGLLRAIRGDLSRILAKALAHDPEERYPSVERFSADLEAYLAGRPVAARQPTLRYRCGKFVRRNPVATALGLLCLVLASFLLFRELDIARELELERDLARMEQRRAEEARLNSLAVASFWVGLFADADPRLHTGRILSISELLARGAGKTRSESGNDPEVKAQLLTAIATARQHLGELDAAAPLFEEALALRRQVLVKDADKEARLALAAAFAASSRNERLRGRFSEAEAHGREAIAIFRSETTTDEGDLAAALDDWAEALHELGRLEEARHPYLESIELRRRRFGPNDLRVAESLDHFALLQRNSGQFAEAIELYRSALVIRRAVLPADHRSFYGSLHALGLVEHDMGLNEQARATLKEALGQLRRIYEPPHPELALALNDLGWVEIDLDRDVEAEVHLREALEQRRQLYQGDHPELVQTLGGLGVLMTRRGRLAEAGVLVEEALAISLRLFGEQHPYVAVSRRYRADWLARSGRAAEAIQEVEKAIAVFAAGSGSTHPDFWRAQLQLAELLCQQGDPRGDHLVQEAVAGLESALGRNLPGPPRKAALNCTWAQKRQEGPG